jgi:hypothetical protein
MQIIICLILLATSPFPVSGQAFDPEHHPGQPAPASQVYLPLVASGQRSSLPLDGAIRVNAPHFDEALRFSETAIFWFGQITPDENYADVRTGYTDEELYVYVAVVDRRLWYDTTPSPQSITNGDAVSLHLSLNGSTVSSPYVETYRFTGQFNTWESRAGYQRADRGNGSTWEAATVPFETTAGWRGDSVNNDGDDKGWALTFHIPFSSLGLSGPPAPPTTWGVSLLLHDRDSSAEGSRPGASWPEGMTQDNPSTWAQLSFGLPSYHPPVSTPAGTATIRHELNGAKVVDGEVGGGSICGAGQDYWETWGNASYPGGEDNADFNIQNQSDISDWPCFAKYYITFPLDNIPSGKAILSAKLTLYQMGGSGDPNQTKPSLIQVSTVGQDWDEETLSWNNAPLAVENVSQSWVDPLVSFPGWPGVPWSWDVSRALAQAYETGQPLRLALYSADEDYHSGKYFVSSDTGEWNARGRPTLEVTWGNP